MQVRELMTANPGVASPITTIQEVANRMLSLNVGSMPVCEGDALVGFITDRDITTRATAKGLDPATHVGDVMTTQVVCCYEDDDIRDCIKFMEGAQVRRVPVLDRQERLVGIVALADLALKQQQHKEIEKMVDEVLEQISEPVR